MTTKRWYVVQVYSGSEKAVVLDLQERIARAGLLDRFGRILVPAEEVVETRSGQRTISERRLFPGYVLLEMELDDDTWHLVRKTRKVAGFVGGAGNRPTPISEQAVQKIILQVQEGTEKPRPKRVFEVGEMVRIKEGAFIDFSGSVEYVNYEKNRLGVLVNILGRSSPVELEFSGVEKI